MKNIVLLCYGKEVEYNRAIVSILSFLAWKKTPSTDFRIICFTDAPAYMNRYLGDVKVEYIYLSNTIMEHMLGGTTYIHRRKICILQDVYLRYPKDDIIFLDSDTFFIADSSAFSAMLQPGYSLMHSPEYMIEEAPEIYRKYMSKTLENAESYPLAFIRHIQDEKFSVQGRQISFKVDQMVWNSGVLGLNNDVLPLLEAVLSLSDEFYKMSKWFISEQLAFGLLLQDSTEVRASYSFINHYHQSKKHVDPQINALLSENFTKMRLGGKLAAIRRFTVATNKLVILDHSSSVSIGAFKRRNIRKGLSYAIKAMKNIPFHPMFYCYTKDRIATAAGKR